MELAIAEPAFNYVLPEILYITCGVDVWVDTSITNVPDERIRHTAVWTGTEMIIWGRYGTAGYFNTGCRYKPATNALTATFTAGAPTAEF